MSSLSEVTQAIVDLLAADTSLGLSKVYYGETAGIPQVPSASVEAGPSERQFTQTGLQTTRNLQIIIVIYHGKVADTQIIKKELDDFVQSVENKLNEDSTLGGLVISGLVTSIEPGVSAVEKSQFFAHRLTWEGLIKERVSV